MDTTEIKNNGDRLDVISGDLGFVSGVLQMLVNLNEGKLGADGGGGNALRDVVHNENDGLDWVLNEALDRVRRSKELAIAGLSPENRAATTA